MSDISLNSILNEFQNSEKLIAFNKLKKFTEENPKDIIALYNLGYMCEILKKIDEAITIYKKVDKLEIEEYLNEASEKVIIKNVIKNIIFLFLLY